MGKIQRFSACRGEEYFTTPHSTSRRGGFSFTPSPSRPTGGTKLAQHAQNTPNRAISGEQGEFCRVYRHGSHVSQVTCCHTCRKWWGFCTTRSLPGVCHRRVGASCRAIPPDRRHPNIVSVGMVPKVQTTSAKNAENGVLWVRWSAFWAQRCLSWCVVRTRTPEHAR